jgi:hypothetical protein
VRAISPGAADLFAINAVGTGCLQGLDLAGEVLILRRYSGVTYYAHFFSASARLSVQ